MENWIFVFTIIHLKRILEELSECLKTKMNIRRKTIKNVPENTVFRLYFRGELNAVMKHLNGKFNFVNHILAIFATKHTRRVLL